jgi:hypothetical protein
VAADRAGDTVSADLPSIRPDAIAKILHPVAEGDAMLFGECSIDHLPNAAAQSAATSLSFSWSTVWPACVAQSNRQ